MNPSELQWPELELLLNENERLDDASIISIHSLEFKTLYPEDYLFGQSPLDRIRQWVEGPCRRRLEEEGERGKRILNSLMHPNPKDIPDLFKETVAFLCATYFHGNENIAAAVGLAVVISRILQKKEK